MTWGALVDDDRPRGAAPLDREADAKAEGEQREPEVVEVGGRGGYGRMGTCGRPPAGRRTRLRSGRGAVLSRSLPVSCHYAHLAPPTEALAGVSALLTEESVNGG